MAETDLYDTWRFLCVLVKASWSEAMLRYKYFDGKHSYLKWQRISFRLQGPSSYQHPDHWDILPWGWVWKSHRWQWGPTQNWTLSTATCAVLCRSINQSINQSTIICQFWPSVLRVLPHLRHSLLKASSSRSWGPLSMPEEDLSVYNY